MALGDWTTPVTHTPAAATQAIATRAAEAGRYHVITGILASIAAAGTAQTPILVNVRDSTTGAGNILASFVLASAINGSAAVNLMGLRIPGVIGNAITVEFAAAGVAASQQTITMFGYTTT